MIYSIIATVCIVSLLVFVITYYQKRLSMASCEFETYKQQFKLIIQNIHAYILFINQDFTVEITNYYTLTKSTDRGEVKRVGELLRCINSVEHGCGEGLLCKTCPIRKAISEAFRTKNGFQNLEATVCLQQENEKTSNCNVSISATYMKTAGSPMMLLTIHDITESKQTIIRLRDALEKTERIGKSKYSFLENLSNEINDQLNGILGWANLIHTDKSLTKEQQDDYMNLIYEHADQLSHMANDILRLARIDMQKIELQPSAFNLHEFCQDIIHVRMPYTHPNVTLRLGVNAANLMTYADSQKLYQVIVNLLANAQKFTNKGHIELAYTENLEKETIDFTVEDTGKGIATQMHVYLFERFYKENSFSDGPGLGLSICKAYIQAMGGSIHFTSKVDHGTRFEFSIKNVPIPANDVALEINTKKWENSPVVD